MRGLMLDALSADGQTLLPSREMVRKLPDTVRGQVHTISHVQAVMSVLEGYSNFLMHRAGRSAIRGSERLEAAMQQRRRQRGPIERLILTITGLEMKMRQYEVGEQFAVGVVDRGRAHRLEPGLGVRGDDADARTSSATPNAGSGGRPDRCRQQHRRRSRTASRPRDTV